MLQTSNVRTTAMLALIFKEMEHSPYRETESRLAGQGTARLFTEPQGSLPCSQEPTKTVCSFPVCVTFPMRTEHLNEVEIYNRRKGRWQDTIKIDLKKGLA